MLNLIGADVEATLSENLLNVSKSEEKAKNTTPKSKSGVPRTPLQECTNTKSPASSSSSRGLSGSVSLSSFSSDDTLPLAHNIVRKGLPTPIRAAIEARRDVPIKDHPGISSIPASVSRSAQKKREKVFLYNDVVVFLAFFPFFIITVPALYVSSCMNRRKDDKGVFFSSSLMREFNFSSSCLHFSQRSTLHFEKHWKSGEELCILNRKVSFLLLFQLLLILSFRCTFSVEFVVVAVVYDVH